MSSIQSALKRARKIVREQEKQLSEHTNQLIITDQPYDKNLSGELVIILKEDPQDSE